MSKTIKKNLSSGRPPKFRENRRPVTVTLPTRTLNQLQSINPDRAKAIVKVTDTFLFSGGFASSKKVEVVEIEPGIGIILTGPSQILKNIPLIKMVEVAPARCLLTIPTGTSIDSLEIALTDSLDELSPTDQEERPLIEELQIILHRLRRDKKVTKAEMLFVAT
jgi:hypothetical protein